MIQLFFGKLTKLHLGGLSRKSVAKIADHPDMTLAVDSA